MRVRLSDDAQNGCAAILNIVAKMVEADVVACLLYDEAKGELVVSPGSFGIPEEERMLYSIPLSNHASASVRTFLSRKPFITPDAQNDPDVLYLRERHIEYSETEIRTLAFWNSITGGSVKINYQDFLGAD